MRRGAVVGTGLVILLLGVVFGGRFPGLAADRSAGDAVRQAESWIGPNLGPDDRLVADVRVSTDLRNAGWPGSALAPDDSPPGPWASYDYVISTPSLRAAPSALASRALASVSLVATFGAGSQRTDVLRINPEGNAKAGERDAALRAASAKAGRQLVTSQRVQIDPRAAQALLAGAVDPHVLSVLVALGSQYRVQISGFSNPASDGSEIGPYRAFTVTTIDDAPVADGPQAMEVAAWFAAQHAPFRPSTLGIDDGALLVVLPLTGLDSYGTLSQAVEVR